MDIRVVALEREETHSVYGSAGIMLDKKYVITTANIVASLLNNSLKKYLGTISQRKVCSFSDTKNTTTFKIFWKETNCSKYHVTSGNIFATFICENLRLFLRRILMDWSIDTPKNNTGLDDILSVFFVIQINETGLIDGFTNCLRRWWDLIKNVEINQMDDILVKSAAFGNKTFLDSYSRGIVSNTVGPNNCLIVSDCALTPGSEGSPVFSKNTEIPVGIVISASSWWKGDWTGLTLILDIRAVLAELFQNDQIISKCMVHHRLLASTESSLIQIYCGPKWGTAIILSQEGVLLTNSHVIDLNHNVTLHVKGQSVGAKILYKTPNDEVFDLAVLQCDPAFLNSHNRKPIKSNHECLALGEEVYAAGFALFSKTISSHPMISKGCIVQSNEAVIRTTCCVNPGMSGGAILNRLGEIVAVIVCNSRLNGHVFPKFNMAIPYGTIKGTLERFLNSKDTAILSNLYSDDPKITSAWKKMTAKL
ncbi:uncharacterized protein LOC100142531 [Tribolium castaneum]|uniref:Peroxisomal leader peptide-processing protease n=1 Tax=Tribolium castaneum TaxID=7070 RepID=D6WQY8_TRICA|nr:PREDICTED: uncharacterized protein LOC100142531 [Tribolium castaneum]EFA06487.2 Peroxisomal leader peptide-processing protease-like Protein [Tribolium castaneum]|eukprot:XP_001810799.2 PREDICTED: uncharacterized protein LOC100142531 [Tribolium castaneum]